MDTISISLDKSPHLPHHDRVLAGMLLIRKYDNEAEMHAEHDQVWYGSASSSMRMTQEERRLLGTWGWIVSQDSWRHFV